MLFFHVLALAMKIVMFFEPIKHIKIEKKNLKIEGKLTPRLSRHP